MLEYNKTNRNIIAGIVCYNPDIKRLRKNIDSIEDQVDRILICDNKSNNYNDIVGLTSDRTKIKIIPNAKNEGIAKALNIIFEEAKKNGYSYVLTLDQDSICPRNIITEYKKNIAEDVGILTPLVKDIHLQEYYEKPKKMIDPVERCITSASLTSIRAWDSVNGFDESMFIDCVDFDFCDRIRTKGFKILRVNNVVLLHEIGNITKHYIGPFKIEVKNHNAFRKYYITRNTIYIARKSNKKIIVLKSYLQCIKQILLVLLFEDNKIEKERSLINGMHDGAKAVIPDKWR